MSSSDPRDRLKVVIAGAGVAGLEAALALSRHAPGLVDVELIAPTDEFVYRPLLVAEPFGIEATIRFDLEPLVARTGARLRRDALLSVEPANGLVRTAGGDELRYDALLLAVGALPVESVPGAIGFGTEAGIPAFDHLLTRLGRGGSKRIAFVVPKAATWTIAAYELALLTAAESVARGVFGTEILLVTHETSPLESFGDETAQLISARLKDAGVELHVATPVDDFRDGRLRAAGGESIACDQAIALPALAVEAIPGLPHRPTGFLPTDVQMHVSGLERVWAAGDVTSFPIKQGGLAAQQADVAARAIAARAGAHIPVQPFRPVLRAALITGEAPEFLRAHRGGGASDSSHSREPLWWPPEKLAGRYLSSLLAAATEGIEFGELIDLDPPDDPALADAENGAAVALLLAAADSDARAGNLGKALASLVLVERLDLVLPPEYVARRDRWRRELDPASAISPAGARIEPGLISAAGALSDLQRRIGRLRELEERTTGRMGRDLSHLDEGLRQLHALSRETGLLPPDR